MSNLVKQLINKWTYHTCIRIVDEMWSRTCSNNEVTIPALWSKIVKFGQQVFNKMDLPYLHDDQKWSKLVQQINQKWSYHTGMVLKSSQIWSKRIVKFGQIWSNNCSTKLSYHTWREFKCHQIWSISWSINELTIPAWWSKVVKLGQTVKQENGLLYMHGDQMLSNFV